MVYMVYMTDITNKKYGHLTTIRITENPSNNEAYKRRYRYWLCQCDCGNFSTVKEAHLLSGSTKSCGCSLFRRGRNSPEWEGYGEISGDLFWTIKDGARRRNMEFSITKEYIWDLFLKQNRKCALSNIDIKFSSYKGDRSERTASLDRIDNNKGYINGNVRWVHKDINRIKWELSDDLLFYYCENIYKHLSRQKETQI